MPPNERSGPEGPPRVAAAKQANTRIVPDRVDRERRRRNARLAHRAMPLTVWYGPRPLLAIPLAEYLERRWAA
jgi:hypothetical protein